MDNYNINISEETYEVHLDGDVLFQNMAFEWVTPPATRNSFGVAGQMSFDDDFLYICVAANQWARQYLLKGW